MPLSKRLADAYRSVFIKKFIKKEFRFSDGITPFVVNVLSADGRRVDIMDTRTFRIDDTVVRVCWIGNAANTNQLIKSMEIGKCKKGMLVYEYDINHMAIALLKERGLDWMGMDKVFKIAGDHLKKFGTPSLVVYDTPPAAKEVPVDGTCCHCGRVSERKCHSCNHEICGNDYEICDDCGNRICYCCESLWGGGLFGGAQMLTCQKCG